jgi:hypothetical protein
MTALLQGTQTSLMAPSVFLSMPPLWFKTLHPSYKAQLRTQSHAPHGVTSKARAIQSTIPATKLPLLKLRKTRSNKPLTTSNGLSTHMMHSQAKQNSLISPSIQAVSMMPKPLLAMKHQLTASLLASKDPTAS